MFIMASVCTLVFYGYYHDDQVVDVLSLMAVFTDNEQIRHFPSKSREFQKSFICRDRCCWPCWRNREEEQTSVAAFFFRFLFIFDNCVFGFLPISLVWTGRPFFVEEAGVVQSAKPLFVSVSIINGAIA